MKILKSNKLKLPILYYITDREEIKELPIGIPFIYGDEADEEYFIRLLEYEVLYQNAIKSGYAFNFKKILKDNGFEDIREFDYHHPMYMDCTTEEGTDNIESEENLVSSESFSFKEYCKDASAYVDQQKLKDLKVFPVWVDTIEKSVETNIQNFAIINPNMYNKKLGGMYGGIEFTSPKRNLIIVDISNSIPKGVSSTILPMSKNMAESFYADILVTGRISVLYEYERLHELDVEQVYEEVGMSNEQVCFKKLLTGQEKAYKTCIAFGDNDWPGSPWWSGEGISDVDGKKMCKWKIDNLISFHTSSTHEIAGYARWFDVEESNIQRIEEWVKYLN